VPTPGADQLTANAPDPATTPAVTTPFRGAPAGLIDSDDFETGAGEGEPFRAEIVTAGGLVIEICDEKS
jgi:hypothetical protein